MRFVGVANRTVYRVLKEFETTGECSGHKKSPGRKSIIKNVDEHAKYCIRKIIHEFFADNEIPTLNKIHAVVKSHPDIPSFSRSSLAYLMKEMDFK